MAWSGSSHLDSFGNLVEEFLCCPDTTRMPGSSDTRQICDRSSILGGHSLQCCYSTCWKVERHEVKSQRKVKMEKSVSNPRNPVIIVEITRKQLL